MGEVDGDTVAPPDGDMLLPDSEGDAVEVDEGLDVSAGDEPVPPPPLSPPPQEAIRPLNKPNAKAKAKIFVFITPRFTICGENNEPLVDYDTAFTDFSTEVWT
ncbi:MAG: hypothetical protein JOZ78_24395 [Chroococcidiopsidaceae cyanobacterium CP_BM_ER_R8_30]|nr:hypothetical protein [Chroococcidiopsidaceae cyanobacterium CP_BM_ER_R8_30]